MIHGQQNVTLLWYIMIHGQQNVTLLWYIMIHGQQNVTLLWYIMIHGQQNVKLVSSIFQVQQELSPANTASHPCRPKSRTGKSDSLHSNRSPGRCRNFSDFGIWRVTYTQIRQAISRIFILWTLLKLFELKLNVYAWFTAVSVRQSLALCKTWHLTPKLGHC
jgi:hypothetical protein